MAREPGHESGMERVLRAAERCVSGRRRTEVRLTDPRAVGGFPHVLRCRVAAGDGLPETVMVKTPQRAGREARLLRDAASLEFLDSLPGDGPWPRFYGASAEAPVLVEADLGARTLKDALWGPPDPSVAEAVVGWAAALGELAARTRGREAEFAAVCANYGPHEPHRNFRLPAHFAEGRATLDAALSALGVSPAPDFDADFARLCADLSAPGPFHALTAFDSHGENVVLTPDGVRLIDFDWGQYRPALLDGVLPLVAQDYPEVFVLPPAVADAAESAYRARLLPAFPEAADDALWHAARARALTVWAVYYAVGYFPRLLERGFTGDQEWQTRQLLKALDAAPHDATLARLADALRRTNPPPARPYPAFASAA